MTNRIIPIVCAFLLSSTAGFAQTMPPEAIGQRAPDTREAYVSTMEKMLDTAKKENLTSVFIGGPMWALDGSKKPKPGVYLLDDGGFTIIH